MTVLCPFTIPDAGAHVKSAPAKRAPASLTGAGALRGGNRCVLPEKPEKPYFSLPTTVSFASTDSPWGALLMASVRSLPAVLPLWVPFAHWGTSVTS